MSKICLPEQFKNVMLLKPQVDASLTSDYVSLKNATGKAWILVTMAQANATQCTITLGQASAVDGTGAKALSGNAEIWYNADLATADTLTRGTAAKSYEFSATLKNKKVWFQLDLANCLDLANNFDCVYCTSGGSNAANILSAELFFESRYQEDVLPAAITD
jgi:hypothetical protein